MSISTSSFYGSKKKRLLVATSPLSSKRHCANSSPLLSISQFDSVQSTREPIQPAFLYNEQPHSVSKENFPTKNHLRTRKRKPRVKRTRLDDLTSQPDTCKENISTTKNDNNFLTDDTPSKSSSLEKLESLNDSETSSQAESELSGYCMDKEVHPASTSLEVPKSPKKSPSTFPIFSQAAKRPRYVDIHPV